MSAPPSSRRCRTPCPGARGLRALRGREDSWKERLEAIALGRAQLESQRLAYGLEVLRAAGAQHGRRDVGVREHPGEREAGGRDSALPCLCRQRVEAVEDLVPGEVHVQLRAGRHARALRWLLATLVLAGEPASAERAEGCEAEAMLEADRERVLLCFAIEQRVAVLSPLEAHDALELRDLEGLGELLPVEVGGADGADLSGADELVENEQRLLERRLRIPVVGHVQRDALEAQSLEARLDLPEDSRSREPAVGVLLHRVERLR